MLSGDQGGTQDCSQRFQTCQNSKLPTDKKAATTTAQHIWFPRSNKYCMVFRHSAGKKFEEQLWWADITLHSFFWFVIQIPSFAQIKAHSFQDPVGCIWQSQNTDRSGCKKFEDQLWMLLHIPHSWLHFTNGSHRLYMAKIQTVESEMI